MTMQERLDAIDEFVNDPEMIKKYPNLDYRQKLGVANAVDNLAYLEAADIARTYAKKKKFKYRHPNTNEYFYYSKRGVYKRDDVTLILEEDDE